MCEYSGCTIPMSHPRVLQDLSGRPPVNKHGRSPWNVENVHRLTSFEHALHVSAATPIYCAIKLSTNQLLHLRKATIDAGELPTASLLIMRPLSCPAQLQAIPHPTGHLSRQSSSLTLKHSTTCRYKQTYLSYSTYLNLSFINLRTLCSFKACRMVRTCFKSYFVHGPFACISAAREAT